MANAREVEEVAISGKSRKKTNVFWRTVPEREQFSNVKVPGVVLDRFKDSTNNTKPKKYAEVVQKSKSDSAILNTRSDPLTVNKSWKVDSKISRNQSEFSSKKKDVSSIFKGAVSSEQLPNTSSLSDSGNPRRASLKNLNVEDKKRVANLIKELAKTGEERELALERLQEERVSFEERLSAVQQEQTALKQEREALRQRLEKSEKLLRKYEDDLRNVKAEKQEQDKIIKKKFQAQPQSTQTSPLVQTLGTGGTAKSRTADMKSRGITQTHSESKVSPTSGRMRWNVTPQVPIYYNSLFDVKVSDVEQEQSTKIINGDDQCSEMTESGNLHELYLREYSLQLRLQEQQIEIQRQQVQLQQQLQVLQQQQQQQDQQQRSQPQQQGQQQRSPHQQLDQQWSQPQPALAQKRQNDLGLGHHQQEGLTQPHTRQHSYQQQESEQQNLHQHSKPLEYEEESSEKYNKHQRRKRDSQEQAKQQELPLRKTHQQEPRYDIQQHDETVFKQASPTQQTNLLQKRTPERRHEVEPNRGHTLHLERTSRPPRQAYAHSNNEYVTENSKREQEVTCYEENSKSRTKDRSCTSSDIPSLSHTYHHTKRDVGKTRSAEGRDASRNKFQHTDPSSNYEKHRVTRKDHQSYDAKVDFSSTQHKECYDINGNLVQDWYPRENASSDTEPYSDYDDHTDNGSERHCHCVYYHKQARQVEILHDQPLSNHSHSKVVPQHGSMQKSQHSIHERPFQKVEVPPPVYQQSSRQQHSTDGIDAEYKRFHHHPNRTKELESRSPIVHHHLHKGEYYHHPGIHHKRSPHRSDHYDDIPSHYVTQKNREFDTAVHQPSERIVRTQQPVEHRFYGITEHEYHPTDGRSNFRSPDDDKSHDLLDDYIHHHQTSEHYNAESKVDYEPRDTSNKRLTKRKISRKGNDHRRNGSDAIKGVQDGYLVMSHTTSEQNHYEDGNRNAGYSLYKPTTSQLTRNHSERPKTSSGDSEKFSHNKYPNSLVEIVEDLEINSGYEERYYEETEPEEQDYDSDEEESTVLDNIFFLKR